MSQEDVIAIFPLPNVVFFPKTKLPLHIFEPRYVEMVSDTVRNRQLIGMFLLLPEWHEDYYGNPPVYGVGCAGEVIHLEELPEQKYNIILHGLYRARMIETVQEFPYRKARVEVLPEISSKEESVLVEAKEELFQDFKKLLGYLQEDSDILSEQDDYLEIVHAIASILRLETDQKMRLLKENDIYVRGQLVHQLLKKQISAFQLTTTFSRLRSTDPNRN